MGDTFARARKKRKLGRTAKLTSFAKCANSAGYIGKAGSITSQYIPGFAHKAREAAGFVGPASRGGPWGSELSGAQSAARLAAPTGGLSFGSCCPEIGKSEKTS